MHNAQPLAHSLDVTEGRNGVRKGEAGAYPPKPEAEAVCFCGQELRDTVYVRMREHDAHLIRSLAEYRNLSLDRVASELVRKGTIDDPIVEAMKGLERAIKATDRPELEVAFSVMNAALALARRENRSSEMSEALRVHFINKPHSKVKP